MASDESGESSRVSTWTAGLAPPSESVLEALGRARLLQAFTPTGMQILASIARENTLPPGTPLFVENMLGESLFVVAAGHLRVSIRDTAGRDRTLVELGPGESVGEAAMFRQGPRFCSATSVDECRVVEISRRDVAALQAHKPQACLKLMMAIADTLATRLRRADMDLREFVTWRLGGA